MKVAFGIAIALVVVTYLIAAVVPNRFWIWFNQAWAGSREQAPSLLRPSLAGAGWVPLEFLVTSSGGAEGDVMAGSFLSQKQVL